MARACIYTLEPVAFGGVPAKVRVVKALLDRYGHHTNLLYTATEQVPQTSRWALLRYFIRHPWPFWTNDGEFEGLAIPHWPLPLWLTYALPWGLGRRAFKRRPIHMVVSGSNHCGLPPAFGRRRFIVWIGTLYADELRGKAAAGDAWAHRTLRGLSGRLLAWEERLIFSRAALILTNGEHTAGRVRQEYPEVASKVRAVIYPVDTDLFRPDPAPRNAEAPYLLMTARINDIRKNVGMLFSAYARVRCKRPDVRLVISGDLPDEAVRRQLKETGLEGQVEFTGSLPVPKLLQLYQGAELYVLSSNQEGLGISMLEALACGVPVVATRCGGPESVIRDGITGALTPIDDPRALAARVLTLLGDPQRMEEMRTASAEFARQTFSRITVEKRLLAAFRDVYPRLFPPETLQV